MTIKGTLSVKTTVSAKMSKPGDKIIFTAEASGGKGGLHLQDGCIQQDN